MASTILFVPYPATGHLNPTSQLARGLSSRGHRVCYASFEDLADATRARGHEFFPLFSEVCPRGFMEGATVEERLDIVGVLLKRIAHHGTEGMTRILLDEIKGVMAKVPVDLAVVDFIMPHVAITFARLGVPVVLVNTTLYNPWETLRDEFKPLLNIPEMVLCPEEFDFPPSARPFAHPGGRFYVEASIDLDREEPPFDWERLDGGKKLIYCSLGSISFIKEGSGEFFRAVLGAVAERPDWQLVLAAGTHAAAGGWEIPPNVIVVGSAPQLGLLRRASLMITHGGLGSVKECAYFGVPMVVVPIFRDQPAVAARVVFHKLGVKSSFKNATAARLRGSVEAVLQDPGIRQRVALMSEKFREIEEAGRGIEFIESLVRQAPRAASEALAGQ